MFLKVGSELLSCAGRVPHATLFVLRQRKRACRLSIRTESIKTTTNAKTYSVIMGAY